MYHNELTKAMSHFEYRKPMKMTPEMKKKLEKLWVCTIPPLDDPPGRHEDLIVVSSEKTIRAYHEHQASYMDEDEEGLYRPDRLPMTLLEWLEKYELTVQPEGDQ